ncbi:MAG: metal ABC transporter substrate-binding protein [Gammaproteobacteria bacterium]
MKLLLPLFLLALVASPAQAQLRVFACEPEWAALAAEIGGDRLAVYTATGPHQDPHHVDARPSLIAQVRKADLVICTGAELEIGWLPVLIARAANPALKGDRVFYAADHVTLLDIPAEPVDRSKGDIHAMGNPHVHLDPRRMMDIGDALARTLGRIDGANAATYAGRAQALRARLTAMLATAQVEALRGRRWFVAHDAWPYLFDWLGAEQAGALEPVPGVPPSSRHLAKLGELARQQPVHGIIHTRHDDARPVQWLARNGNTCAIELPYTVGATPEARDLAGWYGEILARLARGCTPAKP